MLSLLVILQLVLKFGDTVLERVNRGFDLFPRVSRRDELRTVPIVGLNIDHEDSFHFSSVSLRRGDGIGEIRMVAGVEDLGMPQDLETLPVRVVHQEEGNAIPGRKAAHADHLAVSTVVSEANLILSERLQKTTGATPMLKIRPSILGDRCKVETVATLDELDLFIAQTIDIVGIFKGAIGQTVVVVFRLQHRWRQDSFRVSGGHDGGAFR